MCLSLSTTCATHTPHTPHTHPTIDLTLAEGARREGSGRAAYRSCFASAAPSPPPSLSASLCSARHRPSLRTVIPCSARGKFSRAGTYAYRTRDLPLRTESKRRESFVNRGHDHSHSCVHFNTYSDTGTSSLGPLEYMYVNSKFCMLKCGEVQNPKPISRTRAEGSFCSGIQRQ